MEWTVHESPRTRRGTGCLRQLFEACIFVEGESDRKFDLKQAALLGLFLISAAALLSIPTVVSDGYPVYWAAVVLVLVTTSSSVLYIIICKDLNPPFLVWVGVFFTASILMLDFSAIANSLGSGVKWPYFIVLVDFLFAANAPKRLITCLTATVVVYLACVQAERSWRFGMFDVPDMATDADRRRAMCECDALPCGIGIGDAWVTLLDGLFILVLHLVLADKFGVSVLGNGREHERMVQLASRVATMLTDFDLDDVEDELAKFVPVTCTQKRLHLALLALSQNLRTYRPFLPEALFLDLHSPMSHKRRSQYFSVAPPGKLSTTSATLVFTDIKGSTQLWEADPESMKKALKIHNAIIRDEIEYHRGYEVKTIGDAFMVAFASASDAVRFAMSVQEALARATWPPALRCQAGSTSMVASCNSGDKDRSGDNSPQGRTAVAASGDVWQGLLVRVGVHYLAPGDATVEANTLTGRYDYIGQAVNKAARIEGIAVGGAVAISAETLEEASSTTGGCPALEGATVISMGVAPLKGVTDLSEILLLLPETLKGREVVVRRELKEREKSLLVSTMRPSVCQSDSDAGSLCGTAGRTPKQTNILVTAAAASTSTAVLGGSSGRVGAPDVDVFSATSPSGTGSTSSARAPIAIMAAAGSVLSSALADSVLRPQQSEKDIVKDVSVSSCSSTSHETSVTLSPRSLVPGPVVQVGSFRFADKKQCQGTACCVTVPQMFDVPLPVFFSHHFSGLVSAIATAATRTDGSIVSLLGTRVLLAWNATAVCPRHIEAALRFCDFLYKAAVVRSSPNVRTAVTTRYHTGFVTGAMTVGHVGSTAHRHMSCVGQTINLSTRLACVAQNLSCCATYATLLKEEAVHVGVMRPLVVLKRLGQCEREDLVVWQLCPWRLGASTIVAMVSAVPEAGGVGTKDEEAWGWTAAYRVCFEKGDYAEIRKRSNTDVPLAAVANALEKRLSLANVPVDDLQLPHVDASGRKGEEVLVRSMDW